MSRLTLNGFELEQLTDDAVRSVAMQVADMYEIYDRDDPKIDWTGVDDKEKVRAQIVARYAADLAECTGELKRRNMLA